MNGDSKVLQWLAEGESLPTKEPHEEPPRKSFADNHNIYIENDTMTVTEFINLTENAFCGEVIKQLRESY